MSRQNRGMSLVMAVLFSAFLLGGISQLKAWDGGGDRYGYHDRNGYYHRYGSHHNHRGYWDHRNGVRFWINI
jgi:hypothetical protein